MREKVARDKRMSHKTYGGERERNRVACRRVREKSSIWLDSLANCRVCNRFTDVTLPPPQAGDSVISKDACSIQEATCVTNEMCTKTIAGDFSHYFNSYSAFLKGVALALVLVAASGLAFAGDQTSNPANPNPCNISEEDADSLNVDFSTDVNASHQYARTIAQMLKDGKFAELDCVADRARSGKERFSGGAWKIHELYGGLYEPVQYPVKHATQDDWNNLLQRLEAWVTARPKSITARVALARAYLMYAYDARGHGFANTVSDSGWKLFENRTTQAKQILDEASTLPTKCPEWYVDMLLVAQNQSWDMDRARALFDEAFKFEPGYYYNARVLAAYLLPKWSGEEGATEKFTQEVADRVGGDQGDALYFEVASANYVICGCGDDPKMSWERIEKGFEASEKLYGVSMLNLNRIAYLATHVGRTDPIVADKVLGRIGEQWDEETWETQENFENVKKWAAYTKPFAEKLYAMESAADANMKTPAGPRYKASFEKTYLGLLQECVRTTGGGVDRWEGKFKVLISIGEKGTVEDNKIYSMGPVVTCLDDKMQALQLTKKRVFPPPPQAPYWVRLDLDWADFAPVAAK
jgi:hypothetical protein